MLPCAARRRARARVGLLLALALLMMWLPAGPLSQAASAHPGHSHQITVDFNDPASLRAVPDSAAFTYATLYREDGMTARDGVFPLDPRLGEGRCSHYHLGYEDPTITFGFDSSGKQRVGRYAPDGSFVPLADPALEPRLVAPHGGGCVIQMTYDPEGDGVPNPFNLISLEVRANKLDVGIRFSDDTISAYRDLTPGVWGFVGGTNLTRVTLEADPTQGFTIDNLVFEPVDAPIPPGDTTPPSVTLTQPGANATVSGVVQVAAAASDNVGVQRVEFYADNQMLGTDTAAPYTIAWDTTRLAHNSLHTLHAKAYDLAGNARQSTTVTNVKVTDITPPTVAITGPASGTVIPRGTRVTIAATATDASGINKVEFRANGAYKCGDSAAPYSCAWTPWTVGSYTLEAKAIDKAGKVAVAQIQVTVK